MAIRTYTMRIVPTGLNAPPSSADTGVPVVSYAATSADMGASSAVPGSSTPAGASVFPVICSSAINVEYYRGFSVQAVFTGAQPQGTLQLLCANDNTGNVPSTGLLPILAQPGNELRFTPIVGTSTYIGRGLPGSTAATGTSGMVMWNIQDVYYKWMKLEFIASTASSGALVATMMAKGEV